MGLYNKKDVSAHNVCSPAKTALPNFIGARTFYSSAENNVPDRANTNKNKKILIFLVIYFFFQYTSLMEPGAVPCLTEKEAMRLGEGASAAATAAEVSAASAAASAAAAAAAALNNDKLTGNSSLPAMSGSVHNANPPFPPSERSKLIRINRDLNSKPTVLGRGGCLSSLGEMETFHSMGDGRLKRSVLVENMSNFTIATASFTPATW
jgi:hypothetical protein